MLDIKEFKLKGDKPYPQIENAVYSPETIRILKNLNYSLHSEFSAITTYVYQHIISKAMYDDIAELLEKIAIVEMMHLDLIGSAIVDFGGDPVYVSGNGSCWNCRKVITVKNIRRILLADIKEEQIAIADYTAAANVVPNKSLSDLLLRIAEDEMLHKRALEEVLDMLDCQ